MTSGTIYTVEADGRLTRMKASAPESELRMQELVAQYPELIADEAGDLLLIKREQPIHDGEESGGRWSLDHLFVTKNAVPVLVELKRAVDTRLRREVVGQMLDYAANAEAYWRAGTVAEAYAVTADQSGFDPDAMLIEFLGDRDPAEFWDQVDSNFRAGKVRLVFVADTIPKELVRIVEYLNDHMDIEIRAIELNWFASADGRTSLAPKVLGHTTRSASQKAGSNSLSPITREEWIERSLTPFGDQVANATRELVKFIEQNEGEAEVTSTQGSIYVRFHDKNDKEFYPFYISRSAKGRIYFNLYLLLKQPALADERARRIIYDELASTVGPLSTETLDGSPGFQIERLSEPEIMARFQSFLLRLVHICQY